MKKVKTIYFEDKSPAPTFVLEDGTVLIPTMTGYPSCKLSWMTMEELQIIQKQNQPIKKERLKKSWLKLKDFLVKAF